MTDPPRLLDEANDELAVSLLRAGQQEAPPGRTMQRTLSAMAAVGSLAGVSQSAGAASLGAAAASTGPVGLFAMAKWTTFGVIGGIATLGVVEAVTEPQPSSDSGARLRNVSLPSFSCSIASARYSGDSGNPRPGDCRSEPVPPAIRAGKSRHSGWPSGKKPRKLNEGHPRHTPA